jgi:hypothetical protein
MQNHHSFDIEQLRSEIAALAARMIAEDGADYATAKRKAAKQLLGNARVKGELLPDNAEIEEEVRQYNALFFPDTQPVRLRHMREVAERLMTELAEFRPYLIGAVLNGTAGQHSNIRLNLFTDNAKEVEIFLLNRNIDFDVSERASRDGRKQASEILSFIWQGEGVHLDLYEDHALRSSPRAQENKRSATLERADLNTVRALLAAEGQP